MDTVLFAFKQKRANILRVKDFWGMSYEEHDITDWEIPALPCYINFVRHGHILKIQISVKNLL